MATAKYKFQNIVFNPANHKLVYFLDILQKLAKNAFGVAAHAILEQLIYAKTPLHLKKLINQAHLENGTYEQIVTHLERESELNGLEAPDELQKSTVSHKNADRTKSTCHDSKKPGRYRNQCRLLKKQRELSENTQKDPGSKDSGANNSIPKNNTNKNNNNYKNSDKPEKNPKLLINPVRHVGRQTTPQRKTNMEPTQPKDRLPGTEDRKDKIRSKKQPIKMA